MPAKNAPDIRLVLHTEEDSYGGRCVKARIGVCHMTSEGLRNPLYSGYGNPEEQALNALDDLTISAQIDPKPDGDAVWYGWDVEYREVYSVDLRHAETMIRTLKTINRKLAKLDERFGRAQDFAEYAGRIADALGASSAVAFGRKVDKERDYDGTGYQWGGVDSLRYWLADAAEEKKQSLQMMAQRGTFERVCPVVLSADRQAREVPGK